MCQWHGCCAALGIPSSTWYYWRSCELAGRPAKLCARRRSWTRSKKPAAELAERY